MYYQNTSIASIANLFAKNAQLKQFTVSVLVIKYRIIKQATLFSGIRHFFLNLSMCYVQILKRVYTRINYVEFSYHWNRRTKNV